MSFSFKKQCLLFAVFLLLASATLSPAQVPQLLNYQGRIAVGGTNFTGTGQFKFALISASTNVSAQATASGTVSFGFLVNITVNNGGSGYSSAPAVSITDGTGSGAAAFTQISGGVVTNIVVTSAGSGYSGSPTITVAAPPQQNVAATYWSNDGSSNAGGQPTTSVPLPVTKGLYSVLLGDTTLSNMTALPATVFANSGVRLRVWFNDGATGFQQLTPDQRLAAVGYAIMAGNVPDGSITVNKIAAGAVGSSQLASNLNIPGTLSVGNLMVNGAPLVSSFSYQIPNGTNIQTQAGGYYFITNAPADIFLPTNANVGDVVRLRLAYPDGTFKYNIRQSAGQRIMRWDRVYPPTGPIAISGDGTRVATLNGYGKVVFYSTNSTASWSLQPPLQPWMNQACYFYREMISSDGSHIFISANFDSAGYVTGLVISQDDGQTWFRNTNFTSVNCLACSANGTKVFAADFSGFYTSADSGSNWVLQTASPTNCDWSSIASSADGTKLVACGEQGIYTSTNSGVNWTFQTNFFSQNGGYVASSSNGVKLVAAAFNAGIYTSSDSGLTWFLQTNAPTSLWVSVTSSSDGTKLAAANPINGVYTSVNSGLTWTRQTNGLSSEDSGFLSVAASATGLKLAAYSHTVGKIYLSEDFGNSWSPITSFPTQPIRAVFAVSSLGAGGGAFFYDFDPNTEMAFVYLGNGVFATDNRNLHGY